MPETFNPFRRTQSVWLNRLLTEDTKGVIDVSRELGIWINESLISGTAESFERWFDGGVTLESIPIEHRKFALVVLDEDIIYTNKLLSQLKFPMPVTYAAVVASFFADDRMRTIVEFSDILSRSIHEQ